MDKKDFYEIEKSFHDRSAEIVLDIRKDMTVPEKEKWNFVLNIMGNFESKRILDVGCGFGRESILLSKYGGLVKGIDISTKTIEVAKKNAFDQGIENINFEVLNVEVLDCLEGKYDIILCKASLHHFYDVKEIINKLYGCLDNNGLMIALEPKSENPIAVVGRKFFNPSTSTEHPFRTGELENIFKEIFGNFNVKYFNLFSPLCFTFGKIRFLRFNLVKNITFQLLDPIDKFLLSYDLIKKYSWVEVVWSYKISN